jgi:transposase InsO family protein
MLGVTKQSYYEWLKNPISATEKREAELLVLIREIHEEDPSLGYRLINDELRLRGWPNINEKCTHRICTKYGIFSNTVKKGKKHKAPKERHDKDLIKRQFVSENKNTVWLTDITEHHTKNGKFYWCGFKDTYSNMVVGSSWGRRMTTNLAIEALLEALHNRDYPKNLIVHSDGGSQFNSKMYKRMLKIHGIRQSVGQAYTCADNAAMESLNATIQRCVLNQENWESVEKLGEQVDWWIKYKYNERRKQRRKITNDNGELRTIKMTPFEYDILTIGHKIVD